jgi:LysM repeat protein
MLRSHIILTLTGLTIVTLSACTPRHSVQEALKQNNQNINSSLIGSLPENTNNFENSSPMGSNGLPLYSSNTFNDTTNHESLIATNKLSDINSETTASINSNQYQSNNLNPSNNETIYQVQPSETVYSISRKFNVHPQHIIARNRMSSPDSLFIGQSLILPNHHASLKNNYDSSFDTGSIKPNAGILNYSNPVPVNNIPTYPQTNKQSSFNTQYYTVQSGDTIYSIGRKLNISPQYIMHNNPSIMPSALQAGQILNLSNSLPANAVPKVALQNNINQKPASAPQNTLANVLSMPVNGSIQKDKNLRGILIKANDGDAVKASAAGEVIYVGNLNNYGTKILVRHNNGLVTNYARLKKTFVQKGQKVNQGDLIASAGSSADYQSADVLFEVRKGTQAVNPLDYLG